MSERKTAGGGMRLLVKVVPGSSRESVEGWLGDTLKVRVRAAPERGKANAAVERLLAETLGLRRGDVRVAAGHTSSRKVVELAGADPDEVRRRLPPRIG